MVGNTTPPLSYLHVIRLHDAALLDGLELEVALVGEVDEHLEQLVVLAEEFALRLGDLRVEDLVGVGELVARRLAAVVDGGVDLLLEGGDVRLGLLVVEALLGAEQLDLLAGARGELEQEVVHVAL